MRYVRWPLYCLLAAALCCAGCKNQSASTPNPFASAELVPPPSTRMPAPGAAQPYYPNDPLPVIPGGASGAPVSIPPVAGQVALNAPPAVSLNQPPPATFSPEFTPVPAANSLAWNAYSAPQGMGAPPPSTFASAPPATTPPAAAYAEQATYTSQTAPRVRLPGYAAPPQQFAPPAFNQVQITELPAYPVNQSPGAVPPAPSYQGDGFQARGTSVRKPYSPVAPATGPAVYNWEQ